MFYKNTNYTTEIIISAEIIWKDWIMLVLVVVLLWVTMWSFFTVSQWYVAITKTFGKMNDTVYWPWLHFKTPLITSIEKFNVQTQKDQVIATAASKDLQNVNTEIAVNYNIDGTKIKDIYSTIGNIELVQDKIISPSIQEIVKGVTANYTAEQLITKRTQVATEITDWLKTKLSNYSINVIDVNIVNFKFSNSFDASIEMKVKAEQDALAQKNLLEKVKYEAQQQIETAKAQAETIKIQAEAISKQWWESYVQLKWIEKWDWKLPTTQFGNNTTPIVNLSK